MSKPSSKFNYTPLIIVASIAAIGLGIFWYSKRTAVATSSIASSSGNAMPPSPVLTSPGGGGIVLATQNRAKDGPGDGSPGGGFSYYASPAVQLGRAKAAFLGTFPAGTALPVSGVNGQSITIGNLHYVYNVNGQNINPFGGDFMVYQGKTGWNLLAQ